MMDGEHILANMKHLHSDVTRQTMDAVDRLEKMALAVEKASSRVDGLKDGIEDTLNRVISTLPGAANKEMERAGGEVIAALSEKMSKLAQQIAGNSAAATQNESFAFAAIVLTGSFVVFFGGGMALGKLDASRLTVGVICLSIGAISGILLGYLMSRTETKSRK